MIFEEREPWITVKYNKWRQKVLQDRANRRFTLGVIEQLFESFCKEIVEEQMEIGENLLEIDELENIFMEISS